jgi:hypothetical protein
VYVCVCVCCVLYIYIKVTQADDRGRHALRMPTSVVRHALRIYICILYIVYDSQNLAVIYTIYI